MLTHFLKPELDNLSLHHEYDFYRQSFIPKCVEPSCLKIKHSDFGNFYKYTDKKCNKYELS